MRRRVCRIGGVLAVLAAVAPAASLAPTVHAQSARSAGTPAIDSLLARARQVASAGDTAEALELLEQATDRAPRDLEALYQRGRLLTRTLTLGFGNPLRITIAQRLLNRGADLAPHDARFLLELGRLRLRTPMLRADAERIFARALTVALEQGDRPLIAECASEYADLYARRYRSTFRRWRYTSNIFFDPRAVRARLHYTRDFLEHHGEPMPQAGDGDRDRADRLYRRALEADPDHLVSAVGVLALLYDVDRHTEMRAIAAPLLARRARAGVADTLPPTERAQLATVAFADGLAAWRLADADAADARFTLGLSLLPAAERDELLDIGRLLRPGDSVRVAGTPTDARTATVAAFWDAADPLLSTPVNEARVEYFARIALTMLRYDEPTTSVRGWRTDRGGIIVRYGEPPVEALFPPTNDISARDLTGRVVTIFRYPAIDRDFVFAGAPTLSDATFAGDFRTLADEARFDDPFRLDNLNRSHAVDSMPVQVVRLRGRTPQEHVVLTAVSVPATRLYAKAEIDRGELTVRTFGGPLGAMRPAGTRAVPVTLPVRRDPDIARVDTMRQGDYRVRVEAVDDAVTGAAARAHVAVMLTDPRDASLAVSDLLLGRGRRPGTSTDDAALRSVLDAGVQAIPGARLAPRDTFTVAWETYGAQRDATDRVQLEVGITITLLDIDREGGSLTRWFGNVADLVGLTPEGDQQLGMRFTRDEQLAGRDRVPLAIGISLGTSPAGRYRLDVSVRDKASGQVARTSREFTIGVR
ncbi:MAG: GWxTD domain-containing protein [Gemmatimonadetes bacterium]|nr:GWxTD domain-containing protein [Gemmatimonadota bacterium]